MPAVVTSGVNNEGIRDGHRFLNRDYRFASCLGQSQTGKASGLQVSCQPPHLFVPFGPDNVVGAVEGHKHQAILFRRAGKPMHMLAGHQGETTGP